MDKIKFIRAVVNATKEWGDAKAHQGYIPTIELFVEEMTEYINKLEALCKKD